MQRDHLLPSWSLGPYGASGKSAREQSRWILLELILGGFGANRESISGDIGVFEDYSLQSLQDHDFDVMLFKCCFSLSELRFVRVGPILAVQSLWRGKSKWPIFWMGQL